jgi:tetratricopeptide (TPR) repeat protein
MSRKVKHRHKRTAPLYIATSPEQPAAATLLAEGLRWHQAGQLAQAERLYRQVLQSNTQHPDALHLLGVLATQRGQAAYAVELLLQARQQKTTVPSIHIHLGNALGNLGRFGEAAACYQQALRLQPDSAEAHNNLGTVLQQQQQLTAAIAHYQEALRLHPHYAEAHFNLGRVLQVQGEYATAMAHYQEAVRLQPTFADAHNNLGTVLLEYGDYTKAMAHFQEALRLQPHYAEAHINLSVALKEQGRLTDAITHYQEALRLQPNCADTHYNFGNVLQEQGALDAAIAAYQEAIRLQPDHVEAHWNLGLTLLLAGRLRTGWPEYEWRFRRAGVPYPSMPQPRWGGAPFHDKTLLVWTEQGYGDTLLFVRYLPMVKARGGRVVLACQPELERLLQDCVEVDGLLPCQPEKIAATQFDLHIPLLSLPGLFETTLDTIPVDVPYITPDPALTRQWQIRLGQENQFRIGLVWAGNPQHPNDRNRSCQLSDFAPLATLPNVALFSLQKGSAAAQAMALPKGIPLTDLGSALHDFAETAAVIANLDLVITVDTAVAHLAGAMGKPVWTLLPFVPDWRWMRERDESPWYPSMRLWRQSTPGDWATVCQRVVHAVQDLTHANTATSPLPQQHRPGIISCQPATVPAPPVKHRPVVLFSTTRMWNPGDDFILFGIRNLLEPLIGPYNALVYNRHPELHQLRLRFNQPATITGDDVSVRANLYELLKPHLLPRDNSWHPGLDLATVDLVVFAGTPEWFGGMVAPLVERLLATQIPTLYLGIGAFEGSAELTFEQLPPADRALLQQAALITVRDETCAKLLAPLQPLSLPCPALFATELCQVRQQKKRLALSTQGSNPRNGQRIDPVTRDYSIALFKALAQRYECALICHYVDELEELRSHLGKDMECIYVYDARDYLTIYDAFDLTVTTRVHGAGLCASLGMPGFVIAHSTRSATTQGFLSERLHPHHDPVDSAVRRIEQYDVATASARLCAYKEAVRTRYTALLQPVLTKPAC